MLRRTTLAAALVAAAATFLVAPPAQAASYVVSLSADALNADVGEKVTLSGKVGGTGAVGRTVYLQRRSSNGAWGTVATTTTNGARAYSKAVTIPAAGTNAYRAVVNASSTLGRGTSVTRFVTGYTWVDLHAAAYASDGFVQRGWHGQLNGRIPPRQTFGLSGDAWLYWDVDGLCDQVLGTLEQPSGASPTTVTVGAGTSTAYTVGATPRAIDLPLTGVGSLTVSRDGGGYVALISPRAHCSAATLPIAYD